MKVSRQRPRGVHGKCPCCSADLILDPNRRFGIIARPECDRVIWWLIPSDHEAPFLSSDFDHDLLKDFDSLDSLDTVELVMALEEEVGHEIPDEEAENFKSVKDILEYMEKHRKRK